jgi:type IV pilus assembly protein PilO
MERKKMDELKSKIQHFLFFLILVFFLIAFVFSYFIFVQPLKSDLTNAYNQLQFEKKMYAAVEKSINKQTEEAVVNSRELQKEVPVAPLIDQFILQIEKAEVVSNSTVHSISFTEEEMNLAAEVVTEGENAISEEEKGETAPAIPKELKKITAAMTVTSEGYKSFYAFLEQLESLERMTTIDSFQLSGNEELLTNDVKAESLTYTMNVSTYYLPTLDELINDLPAVEYPPPADKNNPLYHGGMRDESS